MKIAVVGVGAVGAWCAGNLIRTGHDVTVVARGASLEAVRTRGIVLNNDSPYPAPAVTHVRELDHADVILLAMKATGQNLAEVLDGAPEEALIAVTQNSVEAAHAVAEVVGHDRTLPGVVRGYFHHVGPAAVEFHGGPSSYTTGTWEGRENGIVEKLAHALTTSGVDCIVRDDIFVDVWEKAMFVATTGALGAVANTTLGGLRVAPLRRSLEALMKEAATVGCARGVPLSDDVVARTMTFADSMPAGATTSMQRDLTAGDAGELDAQLGAIVREAERAGVRAPLFELCHGVLTHGLTQHY